MADPTAPADSPSPARPHRRRLVLLAAALLLLSASPAEALVLPGAYVLARCQERLAKSAGLRLQLEIDEAGDLYRETWTLDPRGRLLVPRGRPRVGLAALGQLFGGDLRRLLAELGVDTSRTALGRLDGRVVVTVGALHREIQRPQLWVDQETFFPVRLLAGGRDLLLREVGAPPTQGLFPRRIQVQEGGQLLWQAQVLDLGKLP